MGVNTSRSYHNINIIMLLLLMMQLEKLGFIAFDKNMMFLILLRNGKL
jgi:hypothetical protein